VGEACAALLGPYGATYLERILDTAEGVWRWGGVRVRGRCVMGGAAAAVGHETARCDSGDVGGCHRGSPVSSPSRTWFPSAPPETVPDAPSPPTIRPVVSTPLGLTPSGTPTFSVPAWFQNDLDEDYPAETPFRLEDLDGENRLFKNDADWEALLLKWEALGQAWAWQRPLSRFYRGWALSRLLGEEGVLAQRYAEQQLHLARKTHPRSLTLAEQISPTARAAYDLMAPVQRALGRSLVHLRGWRALARGDDPALGAWLCIALFALSVGSALLIAGWEMAAEELPWDWLVTVVFRLLGLVLLGPHMRLLGHLVEEDERAWDAWEARYAAASEQERKVMEARAEASLDAEPTSLPLSLADVLVHLTRFKQVADARHQLTQTEADRRVQQRRARALCAEHVLLVPGHSLQRGKKLLRLDPQRSTIVPSCS